MIDGRLLGATSAVAALGIALGDWGMIVGLVAAALVVGAVARRRGASGWRSVGLGALAAAATTFMWLPALVLLVFVLAPFDSTSTDPWYDYLALPGAPLVLLAQGAALVFVSNRAVRWSVLGGGAVAIAVMFAYVATLDLDDGSGANIGAGILFLALGASVALVAAGFARDRVRRSASRESAR